CSSQLTDATAVIIKIKRNVTFEKSAATALWLKFYRSIQGKWLILAELWLRFDSLHRPHGGDNPSL
ncbi:hypothetical protein DBO95_27650, partial [Yersinia pestis]